MTESLQLWQGLTALGVELRADGDCLRFHPRERVPAELVERMREHKTDLLYLLTSKMRCPWCESRKLLEGRRGLWYLDCRRLAWIHTPDGGTVRVDFENQIVLNS